MGAAKCAASTPPWFWAAVGGRESWRAARQGKSGRLTGYKGGFGRRTHRFA